MSCKTPILSFVVFEQLLDVLKLAVFVKYNSLISYENNERTNFFSMEARSKILFDSESRCNEEVYTLWDLHTNFGWIWTTP